MSDLDLKNAQNAENAGNDPSDQTTLYAEDWNALVTYLKGTTWISLLRQLLRKSLVGVSLASEAPDGDEAWNDIAVNEAGVFMAVAEGAFAGEATYSEDGVTWDSSSSFSVPILRGVCYAEGLGLWIAVGGTTGSPGIATTNDVRFWGAASSPPAMDCEAVAWSPKLQRLVTVGSNITGDCIAYSDDGDTWTGLDPSTNDRSLYSVIWCPELEIFVAGGRFDGAGGVTYISSDGENWTEHDDAGAVNLQSIAWSAELGIFMGSGDLNTAPFYTSPDGIEWTEVGSPIDARFWRFAWSPLYGCFLGLGYDTDAEIYGYSTDGLSITEVEGIPDLTWTGLVWSDFHSMFVGVANDGTGNGVIRSLLIAGE